jgi:hypothetical protein
MLTQQLQPFPRVRGARYTAAVMASPGGSDAAAAKAGATDGAPLPRRAMKQVRAQTQSVRRGWAWLGRASRGCARAAPPLTRTRALGASHTLLRPPHSGRL